LNGFVEKRISSALFKSQSLQVSSTKFSNFSRIFTISGGCCGSTKKRTIVGGWAWAWWLVTDVQKLSLEVMTLNPMCEMVETAQGVALTVTGVAQVKIMKVIAF
jgi:uncharacterized membrane protein YqiK